MHHSVVKAVPAPDGSIAPEHPHSPRHPAMPQPCYKGFLCSQGITSPLLSPTLDTHPFMQRAEPNLKQTQT